MRLIESVLQNMLGLKTSDQPNLSHKVKAGIAYSERGFTFCLLCLLSI